MSIGLANAYYGTKLKTIEDEFDDTMEQINKAIKATYTNHCDPIECDKKRIACYKEAQRLHNERYEKAKEKRKNRKSELGVNDVPFGDITCTPSVIDMVVH